LEEEDKKKAKTKQDQKHYTVEGVEGVLRWRVPIWMARMCMEYCNWKSFFHPPKSSGKTPKATIILYELISSNRMCLGSYDRKRIWEHKPGAKGDLEIISKVIKLGKNMETRSFLHTAGGSIS
jgi:hypothetical protein